MKRGKVGSSTALVVLHRQRGNLSVARKHAEARQDRIHQSYIDLARIAQAVRAVPVDMRPRLRKP
jgi:hypothetical protein